MKRSLAGKIQRTNVTGSFCRDRKILLAPCTSNEIAGTQVQYLKQIIPMFVVFGTVCTEAYRWYIPPVLPVPDNCVGYDINTGTGHFDKFGTTSTSVPDTSATSVRHYYRYRALR